ncbi:MAG: ribosome-associated translation inhibitor RaiA [Cytophagaceae bacterium]|jgi:putative sigma-54 modulation protein|nr:ribosome-associated translation inhibitor RaiA [Cytophagaceae bacterium]
MKVQIQSIHFDADQKLVDFIQKKLDKLETFHDKIQDAEVFLKLDANDSKGNKVVNVKLNVPGNPIVVKDQKASFEEAMEHIYDVLKNHLTKVKEKSMSY